MTWTRLSARTGGDAISFVSQLSAQDFGASATRILPSGIIKAP
jgi:hypothetical protein